MSIEQTRVLEKCMSFCVFHKKHSLGFHSHLSWKTTQEYQLHWQFGWQCRLEWPWAVMWDPWCHRNKRVTISCSSRDNIARSDYKIQVSLNVSEVQLSMTWNHERPMSQRGKWPAEATYSWPGRCFGVCNREGGTASSLIINTSSRIPLFLWILYAKINI